MWFLYLRYAEKHHTLSRLGNTSLSTFLVSTGIHTVPKVPRQNSTLPGAGFWSRGFFRSLFWVLCKRVQAKEGDNSSSHPSSSTYKMKHEAPFFPVAPGGDAATCQHCCFHPLPPIGSFPGNCSLHSCLGFKAGRYTQDLLEFLRDVWPGRILTRLGLYSLICRT